MQIRTRLQTISFLVFLLLSQSVLPSQAAEQIPPSTDVSCSIIELGVRCGNSITLTQGWTVSGSIHTEWYLSTLIPGTDATKPGNYSGRVLLKSASYAAGSEDFSYQALLTAANNDQNASVLISAIIFNSEGKGSPVLGKTVAFTLIELKKLMSDASIKAAADKAAAVLAAADKAAADKEAADAATARAQEGADKAAADKAAAEVIALAAKVKAIAAKVANSKLVTITCIKGKLTKKVTAAKPVCPAGYKKK